MCLNRLKSQFMLYYVKCLFASSNLEVIADATLLFLITCLARKLLLILKCV